MKADLAFLIIDLLLLAVLTFYFGTHLLTSVKRGYLSTMFLLEAAVVFLVGGLIPISSSLFGSKVRQHAFHSDRKWSLEDYKKSEKKANQYIIVGALLFLESLVASALIL
jgi:general stress protein CsbA